MRTLGRINAAVVWLLVITVLFILVSLAAAIVARHRAAATGGQATGGQATGGRATGGRATSEPVELDWPVPPPLDMKKVAAATAAALHAVPGWAPARHTDPRIEAVATEFGLPPGAVASLRTMELAHRSRGAGGRARRFAGEFASARHAGPAALIAAATRRGVPPIAALRATVQRGGAPTAGELAAVSAADIGSRESSEAARAGATAFEFAVGVELAKRGIRFRTEEDLRAEASAAGAPPPALTPDFLIDPATPAAFHGRPVQWIDAKSYPGVGHPLTSEKIMKQIAKYTAAFGPGAFVFGGGVAAGYDPAPGSVVVLALANPAAH